LNFYIFVLVILLSKNKTTFSSGIYSGDDVKSKNITLSSDKAVDGDYDGDLLNDKLHDKY